MTAPVDIATRAAARVIANGGLTGASIRVNGGPQLEITPEVVAKARRLSHGTDDPADRLPFTRAPEVADVAALLMDRFPTFAHLGEWRIDYWFETKLPKPRGGCQTIGKASVDSDLVSARTGYDGLVVVNQPWWLNADENKRQALVYHELSHFDTKVDDTGGATLRTVKHDLEIFIGEAAHFGDWRHGIAEVAEQLQVWRDSTAR